MKRKTPYSQLITRTRRLEIRPYKLSDFRYCQESGAQRLAKQHRFDHPVPVSELNKEPFREKVVTFRKSAKEGLHFVFGVFQKKDHAFVGQLDLFELNRNMKWMNLGYVFHNQFWGKGYATEATRALLKLAFSKMDIYRIEAAMEISNEASKKVAAKSGLVKEGRRLKFFPQNGGVDMDVYASNAIDYK